MNDWVFPVVAAGIVFTLIAVVTLLLKGYVKVPPNRVLIVSGRKVQLPDGTHLGFRIVKGGGTFVFPMLERADVLSLEAFTVDLPAVAIQAANGAVARADCATQIKINDDDASIIAAARLFLGRSTGEMANVVRPVLENAVGSALNATNVDDLIHNPTACADRIRAAAEGDLRKMGLGAISVTLRNTHPM